jgi:hypothetical protein
VAIACEMECPLWVISGHVGLHERESALPLKADIPFGGEKSPLCANSRPAVTSRQHVCALFLIGGNTTQ